MTNKEFLAIVKDRFASCAVVLGDRSTIYAEDTDRLANFREIAVDTGLSPQMVCLVLMSKHRVALTNMIRKGQVPPPAKLNEWITDLHNYYYLLEALCSEDN